MGSSILFGAINDLDLGEAKIPGYTPPGMPKKSDNADSDDSLLSVESNARGSNKWEEQAEELLSDEEKEKNTELA